MFRSTMIHLVAGCSILALPLAVDAAPETQPKPAMMPAPHEMSDMSPETMKRMQAYTMPNEHHTLLAQLSGDWNTTVKFWMDPKAEPEVSNGKSSNRMIMGGRFLQQSFTGTAMGQPFEGMGLIGYDNLKKQFTSVWIDNMATGMMTAYGTYDAAKKKFVMEGNMSCPITNEEHRWYKEVTTILDADHYLYESFLKDGQGHEYKGMEITFSKIEAKG